MPSFRFLLSILAVSHCAASLALNVAKMASPITGRMGSPHSYIVQATTSQDTVNAYMRIASVSVALYDYIATVPGEFRLYSSQPSFLQMSNACVLFIAIRYMSIVALVTGSWGFFGSDFSAETCERYHLVAPLTKLFAVLISQVIVAVRTYAISRKSPWVFWTLSVLFVVCLAPELVGNVYKRIPLQNARRNCTSGNIVKVAWVHYLAAMMYDAVTMGISTTYLLMNAPEFTLRMSGLSRLLLREGMAYFFVLTMINIANVVVFRVTPLADQTSAASLGQAMTMIMSERIILSLQDWRASHSSNKGPTINHELSQVSGRGRIHSYFHRSGPPSSTNPVMMDSTNQQVLDSQRSKTCIDDFVRTTQSSEFSIPQLEIHIQVDEEVKVDYDSDYEPSNGNVRRLTPVALPDERPAGKIWAAI